jgi:hypothetical protein
MERLVRLRGARDAIGFTVERPGGQVMKNMLRRALAISGVALLAAPAVGTAEVRRIEIDVAGYLCGL